MKRKLFGFALALSMLLSTITWASAASYTSADWAKDQMDEASRAGLFPATLLEADLTENCTRADFAAICVNAYLLMGGALPQNEVESPFADTSNPAVAYASMLGFVNGKGTAIFAPFDTLTRAEAAAMSARVYKKLNLDGWTLAKDAEFPLSTEGAKDFYDSNEVPEWARTSVDFMTAQGLMQGVSPNQFKPLNVLTSQEAIIIALRMVNQFGPQANGATEPAREEPT